MNQILVTEKLYITPELYRKKKIYKIEFFLSVLLVCLLFSYYIYAEYDRAKGQEVSQEILAGIRFEESSEEQIASDNTVIKTDNVIVVALDEEDEEPENEIIEEVQPSTMKYTTSNGVEYTSEAVLNIPRLGINYAVLSETSEKLLKVSLNKYWGPNPNEIGNYCIVGHNYKNKTMFGKLNQIQNGDIVELTDAKGRTVTYSVVDRYVVNPTDVACTSQLTGGKREVTLITCTNGGKQRLVVKAREI